MTSHNHTSPSKNPQDKQSLIQALKAYITTLDASSSSLVIYMDGSLLVLPNNSHQAGWGYAILLSSQEIKSGSLGLGKHASAFDAEMFMLARGMVAIHDLILTLQPIHHIVLISNNITAMKIITNTTSHQVKLASIICHHHTDTLLSRSPNLHIEILWTLSHCDIQGNNYTDALTKYVTHLPPLIHSITKWIQDNTKTAA